MCAILESYVNISSLSKVCSKVFRSWDWTSNASLFYKGCRIILGWNLDIVNVVVVSQASQVMYVKIIHKVLRKQMFCYFVYASNNPVTKSILWADLEMHKLVTRGVPWILMGDFNVALNLEDYSTGSSKLNYAISDFKDCICNIEVHMLCFNLIEYMIILPRLSNAWNLNVDGYKIYQVVSKLKTLKKPFWKLLHDQGNLYERVCKLRVELDEVQKALDLNPSDTNLKDEKVVYVQAFIKAKLDEERFLKQKGEIE
ncbi:RNA-directed DNA polymerase, eukaryota, reverse transcriptase zinc-binding domain protein [Tanacetum coccineum]